MDQRTLQISVATQEDREGWAVVHLEGAFDTREAADDLGEVLCDLVRDHHLVSIDARAAEVDCPAVYGVLTAAAPVFRRCGGALVVSGLSTCDRVALRILDVYDQLCLLGGENRI